MLVGVGDVAANDHQIRVEQADRSGQDVAKCRAGRRHHAYGVGVARPDQVDDISGGGRHKAQPTEVTYHGPAAGRGGKAASRAAAAAGLLDAGDLRVTDIAFDGRGCAISQAATSMLTDLVKGRTAQEVAAMPKEELLDELGIPLTPVRLKCAILGLGVLKVALHKSKGTPLPEEWGTSGGDLVLE